MKKNHTGIITILILFFAITLISSCKEDKAKTAGDVDGPVLTAVSYTHLRAHETVLDLVCRLLLEKKNKYNHPT